MRWSALNPWKDLAGLPRESWLIALATLVNRAGTMVMPFLVLFLTRDRGLAPSRAGLAIAVYGVVSLVWAPVVGRLGDVWGQLRVVKASLFGTTVVLLGIPLLHSYGAILLGLVALSLVSEPVRTATMALVSHLAPPERRRQAFALNRLAVNLGMSIGPTVGGFLADVSFRSLFWVDAATCFLAGLVLVVVPFRGPQHFHDASALPSGSALRDRKLLYALLALLPVLLVFFQHTSTMPLFLVEGLGFRPWVYGALFTINTRGHRPHRSPSQHPHRPLALRPVAVDRRPSGHGGVFGAGLRAHPAGRGGDGARLDARGDDSVSFRRGLLLRDFPTLPARRVPRLLHHDIRRRLYRRPLAGDAGARAVGRRCALGPLSSGGLPFGLGPVARVGPGAAPTRGLKARAAACSVRGLCALGTSTPVQPTGAHVCAAPKASKSN